MTTAVPLKSPPWTERPPLPSPKGEERAHARAPGSSIPLVQPSIYRGVDSGISGRLFWSPAFEIGAAFRHPVCTWRWGQRAARYWQRRGIHTRPKGYTCGNVASWGCERAGIHGHTTRRVRHDHGTCICHVHGWRLCLFRVADVAAWVTSYLPGDASPSGSYPRHRTWAFPSHPGPIGMDELGVDGFPRCLLPTGELRCLP